MTFNFIDNSFVSFASYADVVQRDARLFESNEALTQEVVAELLALSAQRILSKIQADSWWKDYNFKRDASLNYDVRLLPTVDPTKIDSREQEFKDLNVFYCFSAYLLPSVADFSSETSEVVKINYYRDEYAALYKETLEAGDWYNFDGIAGISVADKQPSLRNRVRVR